MIVMTQAVVTGLIRPRRLVSPPPTAAFVFVHVLRLRSFILPGVHPSHHSRLRYGCTDVAGSL